MRSTDPLEVIGFSTVPGAVELAELNFCLSASQLGPADGFTYFSRFSRRGWGGVGGGLALGLFSSSSKDWVLWDL